MSQPREHLGRLLSRRFMIPQTQAFISSDLERWFRIVGSHVEALFKFWVLAGEEVEQLLTHRTRYPIW